MQHFTDQLHRTINLSKPPARIISVVPSQTEFLFELGLNKEVVGITKFCIHPEKWFREKQKVGGTKTLNIEKIRSLEPDLIIANKEENVQEQIEELAKDFTVWTTDVTNLEEAYGMMTSLGAITDKKENAERIIQQIKTNFSHFQTPTKQLRSCYLIWKEPYMTVGGDTFIHDMMFRAGFNNIYQDRNRYPQITIEDLQNTDCQVVFLSSEPYPFKQKHKDELQQHLPGASIVLVDGELFSWYGSRLQYAPQYFKKLHLQLPSA